MEPKKDALMVQLRDIETNQIVSADMVRHFQELATGMGLDIRLKHLLPMGGDPYVTHEGIKVLMHDGPGIKSVHYEWIEDKWEEQRFIAKCIITTKGDAWAEGEGDAIGVPTKVLEEFNETAKVEAPKVHKSAWSLVKDLVRDYPLKNVSTMVAINLSTRRMAMTRAYNRAARMLLKVSLPTIEEMVVEPEAIEMSSRELATPEQLAKIKEFGQSSKSELTDWFLQYSTDYGKPETWTRQVADDFIQGCIRKVEEHKEAAKDPKMGQQVFRQGQKK